MSTGLNSLLNAATSANPSKDTNERWIQLYPVNGYDWRDKLHARATGHIENGWRLNFPFYIPMMISAHLHIEPEFRKYNSEDNIVKLLLGECVNLPFDVALLIRSLADCYMFIEKSPYEISIAMCDAIHNHIYRYVDASNIGTQHDSELVGKWSKSFRELSDYAAPNLLKTCIGKDGIPSLFKFGGVHVGLVVANYIFWTYRQEAFLAYSEKCSELLGKIPNQLEDKELEQNNYWARLLGQMIHRAELIDSGRYNIG